MTNNGVTLNTASGTVICDEVELHGTISFGTQCIVQSVAVVWAREAPIVIGDRTIIEDHVQIENGNGDRTNGAESGVQEASVMTIGNDNIFESGCVIRSTMIGNNNWFEPTAKTEVGSIIGSNCIIGSGVVITQNQIIPDNTVVVCLQDPEKDGVPSCKRLLMRPQKDYLLQAKTKLTQKYLDIYLDPKSPYALSKTHRLLTTTTP